MSLNIRVYITLTNDIHNWALQIIYRHLCLYFLSMIQTRVLFRKLYWDLFWTV